MAFDVGDKVVYPHHGAAVIESIETMRPEVLVESQPLMRTGERARDKAAQMSAAAHLATDQSRVLEHLVVL
mgnify:CR=1 FL=1